jgi:hypothetical protein
VRAAAPPAGRRLTRTGPEKQASRNQCRSAGVRLAARSFPGRHCAMRGILLWLLGIPIPVIILLYLFHVI